MQTTKKPMSEAQKAALAKCHAAVRAKAASVRAAKATIEQNQKGDYSGYLPPIDVPQWADMSSTVGDECCLCGKRPKEGTRYTDSINVSPQDNMMYDPRTLEDREMLDALELGTFPVGPECIKKIPVGYRC